MPKRRSLKPYDVTAKDLLKRGPDSWMDYFGLNAGGPIQAIDTDLSTVPAQTDQVYRVGGRRAHLIHVEMQSHRDSKLARRLWRYNAMLDLKYNLRVRSVAVLLRPEADSRKLTGVLELQLPDKDKVVTFYYRVIRAWEQPAEPILTGPLATLPMAPLADVPLQDLPQVLDRIDSRLSREAPPEDAVRIMASTLILTGMRLAPDHVTALSGRMRTMNILKDSSYYQVLLKEGMEKGLHQGRIKEAQQVLFRLGRLRFGRLDKATRSAIEAIDDLERLQRLSERILTATSWGDLLAEPEIGHGAR
jgi:predicted transposase YdaD